MTEIIKESVQLNESHNMIIPLDEADFINLIALDEDLRALTESFDIVKTHTAKRINFSNKTLIMEDIAGKSSEKIVMDLTNTFNKNKDYINYMKKF